MEKGRRLLITENAKTLILLGRHESSQRFFLNQASHKETMKQNKKNTKLHQIVSATFHGNAFSIH